MITTDHPHHAGTARRQLAPPSQSHLPHLPDRADDALLDQLFYATVDGCQNCRSMLLDRVADDTRATHKLVDWACWIATEVYGDLPAELVDEDATANTLFRPSATFRQLAAKFRMRGRTSSAMYSARGPAQRREAADTAVTLVAGLQACWTDFLYQ